jgi:DNA-binding NtrC family response regulator
MNKVLVATQNIEAHAVIRDCFQNRYRVERARDWTHCVDLLKAARYDYLFVDVEFFPADTVEDPRKSLHAIWSIAPDVETVILSSQARIRDAIRFVKEGATQYLTYPLDPSEVKYLIDTIGQEVRLYAELKYLRDRFWRRESYDILRTESLRMKEVFDKVRAVAPTDTTVILTGETGTGKGVIANLIHQHSSRSRHQFISIHCGAIPDTLLESELFGHEKGAFTGAVRRKLGKFEIANHGTLFLDEIGTISPSMQIKLLNVLQDRTFQRVGGETDLRADVRIITATNADLKSMVDSEQYRRDLYYRLNVFPIEIPSLKERREDIPLLVHTFLERLNQGSYKIIQNVAPGVMDALKAYSWPGNIRELENIIERAYVLETTSLLTPGSFPGELFQKSDEHSFLPVDTSLPLDTVRRQAVEQVERQYLVTLLSRHHGRINATASAAGIGVRQLHKLMTRHNLRKEDFRTPFSAPTS